MELNPIYQEIFERAKPYLRTRKNLIHTRISLRYAIQLLKIEGGDEEVVIPALLLHDVGWKIVPEELQLTAFGPTLTNPRLRRVHEMEGARIAREILETLHYPPEKVKKICRIIQGHDSRERSISLSDRIVKDSDKLWRFSRKGLSIETNRFHMSAAQWLNHLEGNIEKWFYLRASSRLATEELARRREEMKRIRE